MHLADPTTRFEYSRSGEQWAVTRINGESALKPKWKGRFTVSDTGRVRELPEADRLYLNNADGTFQDVSAEPMFIVNGESRALASFREWGLAVTFRDVNNDLLPDLYVCNDFANPDRFWINQGNGTFELVTHRNIRHTSRSSMGVDFTDLNADGVPDFMLLDMLDPDRARRLVQLEKEIPRSSRLLDWTYVPRFNRNVLMISQGGQQWFDTAYYS
ncbi:MAG: VCBS repeat-containing protein, partial [Fuerstiella sp.]|nr:VCBS repeat-containing protein [Fuerstiella sp.]